MGIFSFLSLSSVSRHLIFFLTLNTISCLNFVALPLKLWMLRFDCSSHPCYTTDLGVICAINLFESTRWSSIPESSFSNLFNSLRSIQWLSFSKCNLVMSGLVVSLQSKINLVSKVARTNRTLTLSMNDNIWINQVVLSNFEYFRLPKQQCQEAELHDLTFSKK